MNLKDTPLEVEVFQGQLIISIGVDTLAGAVRASPFFEALVLNEETGEFEEDRLRFTDPELFAKEVVHQLRNENEIGETLVHHMLDKAAEQAFENGAEGVELVEK